MTIINAVDFKKDHYIANSFLIFPGFFDGLGTHFSDTGDFEESCGFFGDDAEGVFAEVIDNLVCVSFSNAFD
jgi:hypothetical protein